MPNRQVVHALVTAINHGEEESIRAVLDDGIVSHGSLGDAEGPDGFVGIMLGNVRTGFPDAHVELAETVEEGDLVSFRLSGKGTHRGPFLGIQPTGKTVRIRGIHHVRLPRRTHRRALAGTRHPGDAHRHGVLPPEAVKPAVTQPDGSAPYAAADQ